MKRRDFIKSALRTAILAASGAATLLGLRTRKVNAKGAGACPVNQSCAACGEYTACTREYKEPV